MSQERLRYVFSLKQSRSSHDLGSKSQNRKITRGRACLGGAISSVIIINVTDRCVLRPLYKLRFGSF